MKKILIVPIDSNTSRDAIISSIREFPVDKIILAGEESKSAEMLAEKKALDALKFPVEILALKAPSLEEAFEAITYIHSNHPGRELTIQLGASNGSLKTIFLSAAFVYGIPAIEHKSGKAAPEWYPVLKIPYSSFITDKKLALLRLIQEKQKVNSLDELSKQSGIGASLINYYLYGNSKSPGLVELGLLTVNREKGKLGVELTPFGRLLVKMSPKHPSSSQASP